MHLHIGTILYCDDTVFLFVAVIMNIFDTTTTTIIMIIKILKLIVVIKLIIILIQNYF